MRMRCSWLLSIAATCCLLSIAAICCFVQDAAGATYLTGDADSASDFTASTGILQATNRGGQIARVVELAASVATLKLTSSAFALVVPNTVTLTATVSGATLSGNILFLDGPSILGSVAIKGSKAVLTTSLGVGIHRLTAAYVGTGSEIHSPTLDVVVDNSLVCN
jgi:hypothetical protein